MGSKRKMRFTLQSEGALHEVFSVRQLTNGDLVVLNVPTENYELDGQDKPQLSQKFSFHRSQRSTNGGYTLKETIEFRDGDVVDYAQFRVPVDGRFAGVMHSRLQTSFKSGHYLLKSHPKDRVAVLIPRDIGMETVAVHLIASDYQLDLSAFERGGMHATQCPFAHSMFLTVASATFPMPALNRAPNIRLTTSLMRWNRSDPVHGPPEMTRSLSLDDVVTFCAAANKLLFAQAIENQNQLMGSFPDTTPEQKALFAESIGFWEQYLENLP